MSPSERRSKVTPLADSQGIGYSPALAAVGAAVVALRSPLEAGLELDNSAPAFVGSLFLIRCVRNLAAVMTLCEAGWAPEAQTLLRAMIEDTVTVSYISTDAENLAQKWLRFENHRLPDAEDLAAAFTGKERIKRRDRPKYERWTRLSFNAMAKRADDVVPGLVEYLDYVYPILSDRAHGNTSASTMYVRVHADGTVEPLFQPSGRQVSITLCNAVTAAVTTADRVRALGVGIEMGPLEQAERETYESCGLPVEPPGVSNE